MRTTRIHSKWLVPVAVLASVANGCGGPESDDPSQRGELNAGTFTYHCATPADALCDADAAIGAADEATGAFPQIAVGSQFQLGFASDEEFADELVSASDDLLGGSGRSFEALRPGIVAVVPISTTFEALDLVHLRLVEPDRIRISRATTTEEDVDGIDAGAQLDIDGSDVELDVSASVSVTTRTILRAAPVSDDGTILAGALPISWTSSDPASANIVTSGENNIVTVESTPGTTATITVTMGDLSADITLTTGS